MNRLAEETSPYLLQHADNPVDWYPWGDEAFARARAEDKPILLSVGYAACHWCHLMEHESFEDEETARLMNERFVCVKVDREERPDVDGLYMKAVVSLTGSGGWPMTVFLTPDGRPCWGGTYFPPETRFGMPSFTQVLLALDEAYRTRRGDLERQANELVGAICRTSERRASTEPLTTGLLTGAVSALRAQFDPVHGGFGGAPKFPPASTLEFLLRMHHGTGDEGALEMVQVTLDKMAAGGMYDQLGGGFHRYAIWLVPHFEKMLYDNALLATAYLHAWVVTREERYRRVVEETLDYLVRDMRLPEGGFASAQDADTAGEEGLTYVWTLNEIHGLLEPDEAEVVIRRYGVTAEGNFEGATILSVVDDVGDDDGKLDLARAKLLEARMRRPQPLRDDKALAGWNGLALAAFAEAGRQLDRADYVDIAQALAWFLLETLSDERGRLRRTYPRGSRQDRCLPRGLRERGQQPPRALLCDGGAALARGDGPPRRARRRALRRSRARGLLHRPGRRRAARRPAQGARRPPHPVRELDARLRAPPPRADLRRRGVRAAGSRGVPAGTIPARAGAGSSRPPSLRARPPLLAAPRVRAHR